MGTVTNTSTQNQSASLQTYADVLDVNKANSLDDIDLFSTQTKGGSKLFPDALKAAEKPETMAALSEKKEQEAKVDEPSFFRRVGEWIMSFWNPVTSIPAEAVVSHETNENAINSIDKDKSTAANSTLFLKPEIDPAYALDEKESYRLIRQSLAFVDGIRSSEQNKKEKDFEELMRMFGSSLTRYKGLREVTAKSANDSILVRLDAKDALHHESVELEKERQNNSNNSRIASWVDTGLTIFTLGGAAGAFIAGGIGVVVPVVIPALIAIGTIGKGVTTGLKNYFDYLHEQKTSSILGNNVEQDKHEVMIGIELETNKNVLQYFTQHWKQKKELEKSRFEASRFR